MIEFISEYIEAIEYHTNASSLRSIDVNEQMISVFGLLFVVFSELRGA